MTGYVRIDTINNIADGNVISAADLDGEFNGVQAAFNSSTGHTHDGTASEGAPITKLGPVQDVTISTTVLGVKTTNTVDLGTSSLKFKDFYLAGAASIGGTLGVTGATTLSAALTYGGVTLSNAVTGTGNMVLSASPTLTGTITAAAANFSGAVAFNGNSTIGDADTDTITQAASYVTGTQLKSAKTATNTLSLAAYDVDGTAYTNLITLTASNTPTLALTSTGVGTINNMSIGATTASTGAFTTLTSNGATTFTAGTASTTTGTGTLVITGGLGVSGRINAANFDGIVGANTAAAGAFTTLSVTGVATFSAGTAALPAITTTGDTNTGIFFPAADTIGFSEGGVEAARFDSFGNFGLGVTPSVQYSGIKSFQIGSTTNLFDNGASTKLYHNAYTAASGDDTYLTTGYAQAYLMPSNGQHIWYTSASGTAGNAITFTQAMTLDASGNLGVGTTTPGSRLDVDSTDASVLTVRRSGGTNTNTAIRFQGASTSYYIGRNTSGGLGFSYNAADVSGSAQMTIDSSGNLLVGTTSAGDGKVRISASANAFNLLKMDDTGSTGGNYIQFLNSAGNQAGSINHNGTATVNYGSGSDYRLKENVQRMVGALETVAQLNPCTYIWKADGSAGQGFIAHELQTIIPDAVVGEKDAVNEDGSIKTQTVDTSFLVATLTAAIQEQQALITQLTARITALESA